MQRYFLKWTSTSTPGTRQTLDVLFTPPAGPSRRLTVELPYAGQSNYPVIAAPGETVSFEVITSLIHSPDIRSVSQRYSFVADGPQAPAPAGNLSVEMSGLVDEPLSGVAVVDPVIVEVVTPVAKPVVEERPKPAPAPAPIKEPESAPTLDSAPDVIPAPPPTPAPPAPADPSIVKPGKGKGSK